MTHRVDRSLLLEHDPAKLGVLAIASLRDADWRHQSEAMKRGYSSMAEWAIDELLVMVREMGERLDTLERVYSDPDVRAVMGLPNEIIP